MHFIHLTTHTMNFFLVLHLRQINAATTIKAIKHPTATTTGTAITTGCVADCPPA